MRTSSDCRIKTRMEHGIRAFSVCRTKTLAACCIWDKGLYQTLLDRYESDGREFDMRCMPGRLTAIWR